MNQATVTLPEVESLPGSTPEPAPTTTYGSADGKLIAVTDKAGGTSFVTPDDYQAALEQGFHPATEAETAAEQQGAIGYAGSGSLGFLRGATLGGSDAALIEGARALGGDAAAEDWRHAIKLGKEMHPGTTFGFEVAGSLAPMILGAPPGEAALAEGIEGGITGLLGESGAARAAARFAAGGTLGAGYGALAGVGGQLSEDEIQNHAFAAENYLTAGLKGGLIGGLLGGATHSLVGAAGDHLGGFFGRTEEGLDRQTVYRTAGKATEEEPLGLLDRARASAGEAADEQAFKSLGARTRDYQKIGATAEEQEARAQRIGRTVEEETGGIGPFDTKAKLDKKVAAAKDAAGKELGSIRGELNKAEARPMMSNIEARFAEDVRQPGMEHLFGEEDLKQAESILEKLKSKYGESPDFRQIARMRKDIDTRLTVFNRPRGAPMTDAEANVLRLRGIVEDEAERAANEASTELGGNLGDRYKIAKEKYADLAVAKQILSREVARGSGTHSISLTDVIAAAAGLAHGGPGGVVGGAIAGAVNHVRHQFGNQLASYALRKASSLGTIQRASAHVDTALRDGTRAFLEGSAAPVRPRKILTSGDVEAIKEATRDPQAVTARATRMLGDLPQHAPKVAAAAAYNVANAASYLSRTLPSPTPPSQFSFGAAPPGALSTTDLHAATSRVETIQDPTIVLDRLREGRLTPEHVEALKEGKPESFAAMQQYIRDHGAELRPSLSIQQQVALSMLFETPLLSAMAPENVAAFQAVFNTKPAPSSANTTPTQGGHPMNLQGAGGTRGSVWDELEKNK